LPFTVTALFIYTVYLVGCLFFGGEPNVDIVLQNVVTLEESPSLSLTDGTNDVSNTSIPEQTGASKTFSFDWRAFETQIRLYKLNQERMSRALEVQRQIRARDNLLNGVNQRFRG
jgi:hypothetical protein